MQFSVSFGGFGGLHLLCELFARWLPVSGIHVTAFQRDEPNNMNPRGSLIITCL